MEDPKKNVLVFRYFFFMVELKTINDFRGTERVISSDPPCKDGNLRFTIEP